MKNTTVRLDNNKRSGATIVLMLFLLVIVFIFVAFAIDVGRIQLAQLKLQTSADLAARAGGEAMSRGVGGDTTNLQSFETAIRNEADMLMQKNNLFGASVAFDSNAQIDFGLAIIETKGNAGNGNQPVGKGNGKSKFKVDQTTDGRLQLNSNSISVNPDIAQFPLLFGKFLGRDNVALGAFATAKIQDRDIVVVVDGSTSMFDHDAGTIPLSEYPASLFELEDRLYEEGHSYFPGGARAKDLRYSEFDVVNGTINLSKIQAMKLALLRFRQKIDETGGKEQLGLVAYNAEADSPADADTTTHSIDTNAGISPLVIQEIVDSPTRSYAAEMEIDGYKNFDYNYLGMRCDEFTNTSDGIQQGVEILFGANSRTFAAPILLVMTDGRHSRGGEPLDAAQTALAAHPNMQIYTVTFGDNADQTSMIAVANAAGGQHFHAVDVNQLVDQFQHLAARAGVIVIE